MTEKFRGTILKKKLNKTRFALASLSFSEQLWYVITLKPFDRLSSIPVICCPNHNVLSQVAFGTTRIVLTLVNTIKKSVNWQQFNAYTFPNWCCIIFYCISLIRHNITGLIWITTSLSKHRRQKNYPFPNCAIVLFHMQVSQWPTVYTIQPLIDHIDRITYYVPLT